MEHIQLPQRLSLDAGLNGIRDYCPKINALKEMTAINTVILWNRAILEKLMFPQTFKKFRAYFGTLSFNTFFATPRFRQINPVHILQSVS